MLKGTLDDFTLSDIFRLISMTKRTGRLEVARAAGHGKVYFGDGEVYYAESSLTKEPLGQKLIRSGALTEGQLRKALDLNVATGERVGEILLRQGVITHVQLVNAVRGQIEDAAFDLLRWETGDFVFEQHERFNVEIQISVSVENLIMEAARRLDELEVIKRKIPSLDVILGVAPSPPDGAREINIAPEEWRVLVLIDGQRNIGEIGALAGLDAFGALRTLYGLLSSGLVDVVSLGPAHQQEPPKIYVEPPNEDEDAEPGKKKRSKRIIRSMAAALELEADDSEPGDNRSPEDAAVPPGLQVEPAEAVAEDVEPASAAPITGAEMAADVSHAGETSAADRVFAELAGDEDVADQGAGESESHQPVTFDEQPAPFHSEQNDGFAAEDGADGSSGGDDATADAGPMAPESVQYADTITEPLGALADGQTLDGPTGGDLDEAVLAASSDWFDDPGPLEGAGPLGDGFPPPPTEFSDAASSGEVEPAEVGSELEVTFEDSGFDAVSPTAIDLDENSEDTAASTEAAPEDVEQDESTEPRIPADWAADAEDASDSRIDEAAPDDEIQDDLGALSEWGDDASEEVTETEDAAGWGTDSSEDGAAADDSVEWATDSSEELTAAEDAAEWADAASDELAASEDAAAWAASDELTAAADGTQDDSAEDTAAENAAEWADAPSKESPTAEESSEEEAGEPDDAPAETEDAAPVADSQWTIEPPVDESPRGNDEPNAPPTPAPAAPIPASPRVDRAAVVRELASLFNDEDAPRRLRAVTSDSETPSPENADARRRVEDDDQVNKKLIGRLIDGVKGL